MVRSLSRKFKTFISLVSPSFYSYIVTKGYITDTKFVNLDVSIREYNNYAEQASKKQLTLRHRDWFVAWILDRSPCSVLDVGAGGMHELRLLKTFEGSEKVQYTVAEVSKSFLEQGRKEFPDSNFIDGTINNLNLSKNSFDIVYTSGTIEIQPYYTKPVDELFRVSKDLVVISLWRWAEKNEILKRKSLNYLNTYKITDILEYIESKSSSMLSFLILKNDELCRLNSNKEEQDGNIVNTGDRIVIISSTSSSQKIPNVIKTLDKLNINYILNPYDKENPILVNS